MKAVQTAKECGIRIQVPRVAVPAEGDARNGCRPCACRRSGSGGTDPESGKPSGDPVAAVSWQPGEAGRSDGGHV